MQEARSQFQGTGPPAFPGTIQRVMFRKTPVALVLLAFPVAALTACHGSGSSSPSASSSASALPSYSAVSPPASTTSPPTAQASPSRAVVPATRPPEVKPPAVRTVITVPPGCTPKTSGGNCYEPGEYCRDSDHGDSGVAGDGKAIKCEDDGGWRWESV